MTGTKTVLVVDDDPGLLRLVSIVFRSEGFGVLTFDDATAALDWLDGSHAPDAVVLDLRMPAMDGHSFFRELRRRGCKAPVVIASAYGAREAQLQLGAEASISKPFNPDDLLKIVRGVLVV